MIYDCFYLSPKSLKVIVTAMDFSLKVLDSSVSYKYLH